MLLDDYWGRMNLKVPIYFSAGTPSLLLPFHNIWLLEIGYNGGISWPLTVNCDRRHFPLSIQGYVVSLQAPMGAMYKVINHGSKTAKDVELYVNSNTIQHIW